MPSRPVRSLLAALVPAILTGLMLGAAPVPAAAQGCQQGPVFGAGPLINCNDHPIMRVTPAPGTYNGAKLPTIVQSCDSTQEISSTSTIWLNSVNVTSKFAQLVPDTLPAWPQCPVHGTSQTEEDSGTVYLKPGANSLHVQNCNILDNCTDSIWTFTYAPLFPVAVTPDDSAVRVFSSQGGSQVFVVKRPDGDTTTGVFNITKSCTGAAFSGSCTVSPASVSLHGGGSANVTVSFTTVAGTNTGRIVVTATLSTNSAQKDSGSVNISSSPSGVNITPDNVSGNAAASAPNRSFFVVTNTGPVSATFSFTTGCTGSTTGCSAVPASQTIAGGATFVDTMKFTAGAVNTTGVVKLRGSQNGAPSVKDSGWVNITDVTPASIVLADNGTGATLERSLCLTVAAGHGAATECGDLRLAHALPAVRTKNKARVPTLLYNSAHAHPTPTFPFLLTLPANAPVPDSVTATLTINSTVRATGKWTGADFYAAPTRRAVLAFDALSDTTGLYQYSVQAKSWYGATNYTSSVVNSEYALVNRSASNFGAGWWLAGVERLMILGDGSLLWIEGDGSTRHYASAGTNIWAAPKVDRPDTVRYANSQYTRYAEHGLMVVFDNTGNHMYTINRISDTTRFFYTTRRLDSMTVAPLSGKRTWKFAYDAGSPQRLQTVTAPHLPGVNRVTTVTTSGGRITVIQEPDLTQVQFGYTANDTNRITSRTDRRGTVGTFTYNAQKKLVKDSIDMGSAQTDIVTQFRPYETVGISPASIDTALAYGLIDGPRTDVGDTTLFWQDSYGEPTRVRNALGADTKLTRADPNYLTLVTRVLSANGRITRASYDTRGNVVSTTDSSTCIAGTCATTAYMWDTKWDFVKKITSPTGMVTWMSYDATNGNRLWQQPDADTTYTARRVSYTYDAVTKLAATIQEPVISQPQRVWYDSLGNTDSTKTPTGIMSYSLNDSLGRDTLSKSPMDLSSNTWHWSRTTYTLSDQDSISKTWSPGNTDTVTVVQSFDAEGNVLTHSTTLSPDRNNLHQLQHIYTYDRANRKVTEQPQGPNYGADQFAYDKAGNLITWTPRSSAGVTTQYDALNRPIMKVIPSMTIGLPNYTFGSATPADTQTFAYDIVGNVIQANNFYAKITRAWNQNGTLAADTERVRASLAADPTFPHVYGIKYTYDLELRRTSMKHPAVVSPTGNDSVLYAYDPVVGVLASVTDIAGTRFGFAYDNAMRLVADTGLAGTASPLVTSRVFDDESRVTVQLTTRSATQLSLDTLSYNASSKITAASFQDASGTGSTAMHYAPLGPITRATGTTSYFNDSTLADALGNTTTHIQYGSLVKTSNSYYDSLSAILDSTVASNGAGTYPDTTRYAYDLGGSIWTTTTLHYVRQQSCGVQVCQWQVYEKSVLSSRYGNDLKLMVTQTTMDTVWMEPAEAPQQPFGYAELEEYRYDALGRRIWRRLVRPDAMCPLMDKASGCLSVVERTIWDGDQPLYEIRADGGQTATGPSMECDKSCQLARPKLEGRAIYTMGGGLDHPLSVDRPDTYNDVIVPIYNWRDRASDGICVNGSAFCATDFTWPVRAENFTFDDPPVTDPVYGGPVAWGGSLLDTQKDGSGLVYKRNRYYDPASGRFTQVDPIGLAGGLNAYGFGGGDQVSYTDPFGLTVVLADAETKKLIGQLRKGSKSFREAYDKIAKDQNFTLTISHNKGGGNHEALVGKGQAKATWDEDEVSKINKSGYFKLPPPYREFKEDVASAAAHEVGHAAGQEGALPGGCASDPSPGAKGSCIVGFENTVRSEMPATKNNAPRPFY